MEARMRRKGMCDRRKGDNAIIIAMNAIKREKKNPERQVNHYVHYTTVHLQYRRTIYYNE